MVDDANRIWNWEEFGGDHPTGISETREFYRYGETENGTCFHEMKNSRHITTGEIVLTPGLASNAKRIRVTVDIIE
jgi:hypothetical protein